MGLVVLDTKVLTVGMIILNHGKVQKIENSFDYFQAHQLMELKSSSCVQFCSHVPHVL